MNTILPLPYFLTVIQLKHYLQATASLGTWKCKEIVLEISLKQETIFFNEWQFLQQGNHHYNGPKNIHFRTLTVYHLY